MIRRTDGSDLLLINQHDHALLSGELAEAFGNEQFASPIPREPAIAGISLHDCGWPLHDNEPTLNPEHLPVDVFESLRSVAFPVWTASVEGASRHDPYAGLLVSLHVLSLSVLATEHAKPGNGFELDNPQDRFAVIKFQQRELERQEKLRAQIGLRSEKGAHHAVTRELPQVAEDQLQFNFALLQVLDQMSLAVCCTEPPWPTTRDLPAKPGGTKVKFSLARQQNDVHVWPWPFSIREIELKIPATRIPARGYVDQKDLLATCHSAPAEILTARVLPA